MEDVLDMTKWKREIQNHSNFGMSELSVSLATLSNLDDTMAWDFLLPTVSLVLALVFHSISKMLLDDIDVTSISC